jgi:outer membrane immunogenic protein
MAGPTSDKPAFSGGYFGLTGGYQLGQMHMDNVTGGATVGPFASENGVYGATVGYDVRSDAFVGGGAIELQAMTAQFFDPSQNSPLQGSTKLIGSIDNTFMLTGRVGAMLDPSTLLYAKAGLGLVRTTANPEFFTFGSGGSKWLLGHEVGAGIETMVTDNLSLKLEGLYATADQGFTVDLTQAGQATLHPSTFSAIAGVAVHY